VRALVFNPLALLSGSAFTPVHADTRSFAVAFVEHQQQQRPIAAKPGPAHGSNQVSFSRAACAAPRSTSAERVREGVFVGTIQPVSGYSTFTSLLM
jgi:hypothetical protein